jgi:hypothetical protein
MIFPLLPRKTILGITTAGVVISASLAVAQTRPSLNFYGAPGLIDMPSGEAQPDGLLTVGTAHFGPVSRTTLSFQITPRLSASFRYLGVRNWDDVVGSKFETYYDRSFDLRYQILREGQYVPAVTIGLQDFVGTGVLSGEYIAATKNLTPDLKVTAGLGWGRLGSYGDIGAPFGARPAIDIGEGGKPNYNQWFRGPAAPFAGVEWQFRDGWTLKAEYSSDDYTLESGTRQTFERSSPFNFGLEYQPNDQVRLGAYYLYGSEIGLSAQLFMNPKQRPMGGVTGAAPSPVKLRPSRAADPDAWSPEWVAQDGARETLIGNLNKWLEKDGIIVEAMGYDGRTAQVRIRNTMYDAEAQAIGRVARAMTAVMPASVETFEIVPVVNGMPASKVALQRSDIERYEFAVGASDAIRARAVISDPGRPIAGLGYDPELYPKFNWSLGPYAKTRLFDPNNPFQIAVGLRLAGEYKIAPGLTLSGAITKRLAGDLGKSNRPSTSVLQHVRTDGNLYDKEGDPALEHLTLAWNGYLGNDLYGRVTAGYLESMFGGVSAEVLWKQPNSRFAVGAEVNYVKQREFEQGFGFQDYSVVTGHLSGYMELGEDFHAQLDVGRYLAGDIGATLSLDREFDNGWKVGVFATKTDVSSADFGEGSFDKGIRLEVPLTWALGTPSRKSNKVLLRPITRDGGAKLSVEGRLYPLVRDYQAPGLDDQWGRFWK